jgi:hypothetical protein
MESENKYKVLYLKEGETLSKRGKVVKKKTKKILPDGQTYIKKKGGKGDYFSKVKNIK